MIDKPKRLRAENVLRSQGYAIGYLDHFPDDVQAALAELCDVSGSLVAGTREKAKKIIDEYHDAQKAAVENPDVLDELAEKLTENFNLPDEGKV